GQAGALRCGGRAEPRGREPDGDALGAQPERRHPFPDGRGRALGCSLPGSLERRPGAGARGTPLPGGAVRRRGPMTPGADIAGRVALVTGATGFIGGALARRLLAAGAEVHAVTRGDPPPPSPGMRWWRADLGEAAATRALVADVRPDWV